MKRAARSTPRLMFVLTAAFGELFNAMYMVRGCRLRTAFAMREPWYSLNRAGLPGPAYHFENYKSLVAAIEKEDPDVVCLFSGYLFVGKDFDRHALPVAEVILGQSLIRPERHTACRRHVMSEVRTSPQR